MEMKEIIVDKFASFLKHHDINNFLLVENKANDDVVAIRTRKLANGKLRFDAFAIKDNDVHIVGSCDIRIYRKHWCCISALIINQEEHQKGYGECVLHAVEAYVKNNFKQNQCGIYTTFNITDIEEFEQFKKFYAGQNFSISNSGEAHKFLTKGCDYKIVKNNGLNYVVENETLPVSKQSKKPVKQTSKTAKQNTNNTKHVKNLDVDNTKTEETLEIDSIFDLI